MDTTTAYTISETQRRALRDLNNEHRDTLEALNHAQASIIRAQKTE